MNEIERFEIQDAIFDPVFWKRWNYPDGRKIRKKIDDLLRENKKLEKENRKLVDENDYLRADNEFLKTK